MLIPQLKETLLPKIPLQVNNHTKGSSTHCSEKKHHKLPQSSKSLTKDTILNHKGNTRIVNWHIAHIALATIRKNK